MVWKLDRLARSMRDLLNVVNNSGINFQCIQEGFDTPTSSGKLVFHIFASIAEFEKDVIRERTRAGLKSARGRKGGRPKKLTPEIIA